MIERSEHLRFTLEPREPLRIAREEFRQHLQRDVTIQPGVAGDIHLAHTALAQFGNDLKDTDIRAWGQRHFGWADYTGRGLENQAARRTYRRWNAGGCRACVACSNV